MALKTNVKKPFLIGVGPMCQEDVHCKLKTCPILYISVVVAIIKRHLLVTHRLVKLSYRLQSG